MGMRIGIYHGYELTGSGSNEYTRYLSKALAERGHTVHVLCRENHPAAIAHVSEAISWSPGGRPTKLFSRPSPTTGRCVIHQLPEAGVQQRPHAL